MGASRADPNKRRAPRAAKRLIGACARTLWRRRKALVLVFLAALPVALWSCFPAPIPDLWPPRPGEPRHTIDVVYRDWHTVIVISAGDPGAPGSRTWEEWEYCEKAWYLEGRCGFLGIPGALRALLWPTASGVGCHTGSRPLWERWPEGGLRRWTFVLSEAGLRAMRERLEAATGAPLAEHPGWCEGKRSYHLFHHCHHFTASALRAAGLPIRPWWAFSASLIAIQLDRIRSWHDAEARAGRL